MALNPPSRQTGPGRRTPLHRGRSFDFTLEEYRLADGRRATAEMVRHPGASAVVALNEGQEVVLLRQYRHGFGASLWEIPAGTREGGEAPLACARRELAEESGYQARRWDLLGRILPAPGYSDEVLHLFLARELSPVPPALDDDELLEVHLKPLATAVEMVYGGQIEDAIAIAGLLKAWRMISVA